MPLQIGFPIKESYNLTTIATEWLALSPFRADEVAKRDEIVAFNSVKCSYLDEVSGTFLEDGCVFTGFTTQYMLCSCSHTTLFANSMVEGVESEEEIFVESYSS